MKYLLSDEKLIFRFRYSYVRCYNYDYGYYQTNGILSFAVMDLAFKIIKQQKRKSIILKKRKPIIHLLNYIDTLNFNSNIFDITFSVKNDYKTQLIYNLYLYRSSYRRRYYKDLYKDNLKVIEHENLCIIRLEDDYPTRIQPKNLNLVAMLMHIIQKEEIDMVDADGIIFYCVFLM
jgi:hypothetical protein